MTTDDKGTKEKLLMASSISSQEEELIASVPEAEVTYPCPAFKNR